MSCFVCKSCGSSRVRSLNVGFDGWFLGLWVATVVAVAFGQAFVTAVLGAFAVGKSVLALFQWEKACKTCGSSDVIPAESPIGSLLKTGG